MAAHLLFPTRIYEARLRHSGWRGLNARLQHECRQLRADDPAGRRWSKRNYPGGYTSYSSAHRMHRLSPSFAALERILDRHVGNFARELEFDLEGRALAMTDCWVNIMGRGAAHSLHLHPLSTISGTYYVAVPRGAPGLKFEDPRMERFMAAPPRLSQASRTNRQWVTLPAQAGQLLLFESWLRHEVAPHGAERERISVSFNYSWF
jgi:uncharacterized protein (TIGR02466 family)